MSVNSLTGKLSLKPEQEVYTSEWINLFTKEQSRKKYECHNFSKQELDIATELWYSKERNVSIPPYLNETEPETWDVYRAEFRSYQDELLEVLPKRNK